MVLEKHFFRHALGHPARPPEMVLSHLRHYYTWFARSPAWTALERDGGPMRVCVETTPIEGVFVTPELPCLAANMGEKRHRLHHNDALSLSLREYWSYIFICALSAVHWHCARMFAPCRRLKEREPADDAHETAFVDRLLEYFGSTFAWCSALSRREQPIMEPPATLPRWRGWRLSAVARFGTPSSLDGSVPPSASREESRQVPAERLAEIDDGEDDVIWL
jgi:hypothetical protein